MTRSSSGRKVSPSSGDTTARLRSDPEPTPETRTKEGADVRVTAIAIKNHSRIHDLDLPIRQHAVIVGANDVGKTSILRLLSMVLGASTGSL